MQIKLYKTTDAIYKEFYQARLKGYKVRKAGLTSKLTAESDKLENITRFITEIIDGNLVIRKLSILCYRLDGLFLEFYLKNEDPSLFRPWVIYLYILVR